jgi:nickel-dependent lactate racemase
VAVEVAPGVVSMRWGAWYDDTERTFEVPATWRVVRLTMHDAAPLGDREIEIALDRPLEAPRLETLVTRAATVAITIDDITRPTPVSAVMRPIVERLSRAGIDDSRITIVVASGAHRRSTPLDIERKIGSSLARRLRVVCHHPEEGLADTGVALAGVPIRINRAFCDADIRVGISGVLPHPFAGFSGGGKVVVPGLANLDVLVRTHKYALMGLAGGHELRNNRFRTDMETAVRAIGLHWTVNVVVNSERKVAFVSAGDLVAAHRAAAAAAGEIGRTETPTRLLDALLINAYPKDGEMLQVEAALVALRSGMLRWLTDDAPIVLMGACPEGLGTHGLFGPGGRLFRTATARSFLSGRRLITFSPGVEDADARTIFWAGYPHYRSWAEVVDALESVLPPSPRVGVVPCGPLQLAHGTNDRP